MKEETADMKEQSEKSLRKIAAYAKYVKEEKEIIVKQLGEFKKRIKDILKEDSDSEVVTMFEHFIFETHTCSKNCVDRCLEKERF